MQINHTRGTGHNRGNADKQTSQSQAITGAMQINHTTGTGHNRGNADKPYITGTGHKRGNADKPQNRHRP